MIYIRLLRTEKKISPTLKEESLQQTNAIFRDDPQAMLVARITVGVNVRFISNC